MAALRFSGPVLPDGEARDVYVVGDTITYEPQPGATTEARGWIVPGLVDAHCHIGLDDHGAVGEAETEAQAIEDRDAGALLIRDCGSAADTSWVHDREDLPRLIRAGRHIARTRRYIRNYADEVEPETLVETVARQARAGDGWVKLVGDWISRDEGDLAPSFAAEDFAAAIAAAHEHGAKVTAHCFGERVLPGLIEAGIDCIEHGTGLSTDLARTMAERGIALVPTVMQIDKFPQYADAGRDKFPRYADHMTDLHARQRATIMAAWELGVALYAGSDGGGVSRHGNIAGEVVAMAGLGLPADYALGAASWRAREWLGWNPTLAEGAPADFVVYPRDPLADLTVLHQPSYVVLRGRLVAGQAGT
jgi:imidazolonepropionase-like amidohydrolase